MVYHDIFTIKRFIHRQTLGILQYILRQEAQRGTRTTLVPINRESVISVSSDVCRAQRTLKDNTTYITNTPFYKIYAAQTTQTMFLDLCVLKNDNRYTL